MRVVSEPLLCAMEAKVCKIVYRGVQSRMLFLSYKDGLHFVSLLLAQGPQRAIAEAVMTYCVTEDRMRHGYRLLVLEPYCGVAFVFGC